MAPDSTSHAAAILNACWMVRHYGRGRRSRIHRAERARALRELGLAVRQAFNESEDFEVLLGAIVDGLVPHDAPRF